MTTKMAYRIFFEAEAETQFHSLEGGVREKISKKLEQLQRGDMQSRHLKHGIPVFVEEVGQYRIVFKTRDDLKQKRVVFVGDHKHYEKWYRGR